MAKSRRRDSLKQPAVLVPCKAETKAPSTKQIVYACGECGSQHRTREKADACCVCPKCKTRIVALSEHGGWLRDHCLRCLVMEQIRDRRDALRRARDTLANAERSLAEVLAEKTVIDDAESVDSDDGRVA